MFRGFVTQRCYPTRSSATDLVATEDKETPCLRRFSTMRARGLEPPRAFGPPAPKARHSRAGPADTCRSARLARVQAAPARLLLPNLLPMTSAIAPPASEPRRVWRTDWRTLVGAALAVTGDQGTRGGEGRRLPGGGQRFSRLFVLKLFALVGVEAVAEHAHVDLRAGKNPECVEGSAAARCTPFMRLDFRRLYPHPHGFGSNRPFCATDFAEERPAFDWRMAYGLDKSDAKGLDQAANRGHFERDGFPLYEAGVACRAVGEPPKSCGRV